MRWSYGEVPLYTQRIFLEALHWVINQDTVNEHADFPSFYLPLINSIKQNNMHYKNNSVELTSHIAQTKACSLQPKI